jgi:hypothetical protein
MGSRQMTHSFFLAAGIAIVALLIVPVVRAPFIVVHGPISNLNSERAALSLTLMLRAAVQMTANPSLSHRAARPIQQTSGGELFNFCPMHRSCPLRC